MSNHLNGLSNTKLYRKYRSMLDRCFNSNNKSFKDYGGRGIKVCSEWLGKKGFLNFYEWAMQNGYEDGLTIERKDVNGNYCPGNCCFITNAQQQRNKRNNVVFVKDGEEILEADLSRKLGMTESAIIYRAKYGKNVFAPKFKRKKEVIRDDGVLYSSIREAAKMNGIHESKVGAVCRGERKRTAGHSFRFLIKEEAEQALEQMGDEKMKNNILIFKDKDTHTEIRYVIAYYANNTWYHYLDFPNIDDAKEQLKNARIRKPHVEYGLFEKIEQVTVNKLDEACL